MTLFPISFVTDENVFVVFIALVSCYICGTGNGGLFLAWSILWDLAMRAVEIHSNLRRRKVERAQVV
jgi:hypothetical protein